MRSPHVHAFDVVKRQGEIRVLDTLRYREVLGTLVDEERYEMTLAPLEASITEQQRRYLYGEPVKKLCKAIGYTPGQAVLVLLGEYFDWIKLPNGNFIPAKCSFSELTKAETQGLIDWCPQYGAEHNINILPPEADPARRDWRVRHDEVPMEHSTSAQGDGDQGASRSSWEGDV